MTFPGKWLCFSIKQISILTLLAITGFSQSASRSVQKAQNLGPEDASKVITVEVWLNQHNKAAFDETVREIYQPASPTYHHFLTHAQYLSRFAPSAADAAQVREYLTAHNLTVTAADKYNHYLVAQGRVSDVQNAFNVHEGWSSSCQQPRSFSFRNRRRADSQRARFGRFRTPSHVPGAHRSQHG
jgi:subtilase family serine protease